MAGRLCTGTACLWFISLQAGSSICALIGISLHCLSLIILLYIENHHDYTHVLVQQLTSYTFTTIILIGFTISFFATFAESPRSLLIGGVFVFIALIYWIVITIMSFCTYQQFHWWVCVEGHCPDTQYIFDLRWRYRGYDCVAKSKKRYPPMETFNHTIQTYADYAGCEVDSPGLMTVSFIYAFTYLIYCSYSIWIILSYRNQLLEETDFI